MKANEIKPGDRLLDTETYIVFRVEQVELRDGRVFAVVRYSDQNLTRNKSWEPDAEVTLSRREP